MHLKHLRLGENLFFGFTHSKRSESRVELCHEIHPITVTDYEVRKDIVEIRGVVNDKEVSILCPYNAEEMDLKNLHLSEAEAREWLEKRASEKAIQVALPSNIDTGGLTIDVKPAEPINSDPNRIPPAAYWPNFDEIVAQGSQ